jgi:hypothetical protein
MATKEDNASINVSKPKLEKLRGNDRDTLDIKTWSLQVSRLDTVQKLGDENTAIIVMEALREQALSWALLLQDEKPASGASWKLLQPLLLERFNKVVNALHRSIAEKAKRELLGLLGPLQDCMVWVTQETENQIHGAGREGHARQNAEQVH